MKASADFTSGSIPKKFILFMLPVLAAQILQTLYGAVDLLVVGHFGTTAGVSGISTGSSVMDMITFLINGLTTGVTVLISQYLGSKDTDRISDTIGGTICFYVAFGAFLTVLFLILAPQIATVMKAPDEAFDQTVTYIRICGSGMIFIVAYNAISAIFRGFGNSSLPLLFVAVACVVNIFGDLLLVAVFHMDVAGAAIATVFAQALSVIFSLIVVKRRGIPFRLTWKHLRFNHEVTLFLRIGAPIAVQNFLTSFTFLALCSFINRLGLAASSGYGVANKIKNFMLLIPQSLLATLSTIVGQNVGAMQEIRARKNLRFGLAIGLVVGIIMSWMCLFCGAWMAHIFVEDASVIAETVAYLKGFSIEPLLTSVLFSMIGFFNGHSRTRFVMIQGIIQSFGVRLPVSWLMGSRPNATLTGIGFAVPLSTFVGILVCVGFHIHCRRIYDRQAVEQAVHAAELE